MSYRTDGRWGSPTGRKLQKKLAIVFENGDGARYVPKASPGRPPGSGAWDVFDQRKQRFLTGGEVLKIDDDALRQPMMVN